MKYVMGLFVVGSAVLTMGWVWAQEQNESERAAHERLEAAKAERLEAERRAHEAAELEDQAREIAEEQATRRRRELIEIRDELEALEEQEEKLLSQHEESHPDVRRVQREIRQLQTAFNIRWRKANPEEERQEREEAELAEQRRRIEQEEAMLRRKLETARRFQEHFQKEVNEDHPAFHKAAKQVAELEEKLQDLQHRRLADRNEREQIAHKIEHLHAAAGHLDEAGMPDMARELRHRAEDLERERHRHHPEPEKDHRIGEVMEQMQDMRRELETLRDDVAELREQLEKAER